MAGVFSSLQAIVDTTLNNISSPEIANTVNAIGQIFGSIMLLYLTFKSIDIALGRREFIISENIHKLLMVSIITAIAFDTNGWIRIILSIVDEFKKIMVINGGALAQLDSLTDNFNKSTTPIIDKAPWGSGWLISLIFWLSFFIMIGCCLFLLLGSEIILAISLLFTPLAILSLSFDYTRKFFDGWLSSIVGSIITMVISGIILSIISSITETMIIFLGDMQGASFIAAGSCLMFACFFYYFMTDVKSLAKSLTGFSCGAVLNSLKLLKP